MGNDAIIPYIRRVHNGNSIQPSDRIHAMPKANSDPINFIPDELIEKEEPKSGFLSTIFEWTVSSGRKILVITASIVITIFFIRIKIDSEITTLVQRISIQEAKILSMSQIEKEHLKNQKKLMILKLADGNRTDWVQRFNKFSKSLPQDTYIENIIYTRKNVEFSAIANSSESFGLLLTDLISDDQISDILLTASKYIPETKAYSFTLEVTLNE